MKSNRVKLYLIFVVSVVLSSIVGYYLNSYFGKALIPILLASTLAIILVRLFELSLAQLKQKNHLADETIYSAETLKVIEQLQTKLKEKNSSAQLYTLHWPTKQYVELKRGEAFSSQHSLVYASQDNPQIIDLRDDDCLARLPEVVALDIQSLLRQHSVTHAIPLHEGKNVYGFIFVNVNNKTLEPEIIEIAKGGTRILEQLLRHDSIVSNSRPASAQRLSQVIPSVPWQSIVVLVLFIILSLWWLVTVSITSIYNGLYIVDFGNTYGIVALWGGICGVIVSRQFYIQKQRNLALAFMMFSVGLLLQEFGQLGYAFYNSIKHVQIPYPSVGDIGFFGSVLSYIAGVFLLARATGISLKLRTFKNQLLAALIPALMLLVCYLLFLSRYQFTLRTPLQVFLDFAYPMLQAFYVAVAVLIYLLTLNTKGQIKNQVLLIVIALVWQFICDYTFLYQASLGTWHVNGMNDYMYFISYALMSLALLQFSKKINAS